MSIPTHSTTYPLHQPLSQSNSETVLSRISKRFTLKNITILAIGASAATVTTYLLVHGKASSPNVPYPHNNLFSYYCRESCKTLYNYNPTLMRECNKYCEGFSKDTFPNACILACDKLGINGLLNISGLLQCIQNCN